MPPPAPQGRGTNQNPNPAGSLEEVPNVPTHHIGINRSLEHQTIVQGGRQPTTQHPGIQITGRRITTQNTLAVPPPTTEKHRGAQNRNPRETQNQTPVQPVPQTTRNERPLQRTQLQNPSPPVPGRNHPRRLKGPLPRPNQTGELTLPNIPTTPQNTNPTHQLTIENRTRIIPR